MMAMTMPFTLADSQNISLFQVGDSLKFRLEMKKNKAFATNLKFQGKGVLPDSDKILDDEYTPIKIGEFITDVKLLDIDSNEVSLSISDGKFRLISFIFTRCPMPNMCPAIVAKNQYLAQSF